MPIEKIEYEQWRKVITRAQIGMAICVFFAEAVINTFLYITRFAGSVYSNPINPLKDWGTQTRSSIKFVISPLQPEGVSLACGNSEFKPSPFLRYLFLLRFFFH